MTWLSCKTAGRRLRVTACLALIALFWFSAWPEPCRAFGPKGHAGIYLHSLKLLEALDEDRCATQWHDEKWRSYSSNYPDVAVK